jgi:hypothetical protein
MRWTDLPPDRDPADAGGAMASRAEWADLRQRLERLPPGHPSRPSDEGEDQPTDRPAGQDHVGERGSSRWRGVKDDEAGRHREPGGHAERDAGQAATPGRREPYRPWFTAGESPEPWFAADPD